MEKLLNFAASPLASHQLRHTVVFHGENNLSPPSRSTSNNPQWTTWQFQSRNSHLVQRNVGTMEKSWQAKTCFSGRGWIDGSSQLSQSMASTKRKLTALEDDAPDDTIHHLIVIKSPSLKKT